MERPVAVVADGDSARRVRICDALARRKLAAVTVADAAELNAKMRRDRMPIVFADVTWPGLDVTALTGRNEGGGKEPSRVVVALCGVADTGLADRLFAAGVSDVLGAGVDDTRLGQAVHRAISEQELLEAIRSLRAELRRREGYDGLVGRSAFMQLLRERVGQLAGRTDAVWIYGEPGAGKEHVARSLHDLPGESDRPFIVLRCAGASHEDWSRAWGDGLGESARGGTLYLDRVSDADTAMQEGIASVLVSGGISDSVRVLASSLDEPRALADSGRVVPPLVEHLAAHSLHITPLRERHEDIPLLASHFIARIRAINQLPPLQLEPETLRLLESYGWPQNLSELRNALEHAMILAADGRIRPRDLPERVKSPQAAGPAERAGITAERTFREAKRDVVQAFERAYLGGLMDHYNGNVTAASQAAGMLRSALQRLLRKSGLKSSEFRRKSARHGATVSTRTPSGS